MILCFRQSTFFKLELKKKQTKKKNSCIKNNAI